MLTVMGYFKIFINSIVYDLGLMIIQIIICSMVGYGFKDLIFRLKASVRMRYCYDRNSYTLIMLPLYMKLSKFSLLG